MGRYESAAGLGGSPGGGGGSLDIFCSGIGGGVHAVEGEGGRERVEGEKARKFGSGLLVLQGLI